ncbi:hypothetical protein PV325_006474 [Microctonus aethiopoides]|nr:hypothetical protein PV325_006474 [Microctonus aethiopoides]
MGTLAATLNPDTSNHINHHVKAGKVQINEQAGQAKRKRDNGASNDIPIPKVKRINDVTVNDYNTSDSDCSDSMSDSESAIVNDNINSRRHGHGQSNCYHDTKYLKCAGIHPTKVCDVEDTPKNYKCANCGNNHKANDINCQVYINYLQNNKIKSTTTIKNSGDITQLNADPNKPLYYTGTNSYAEITKKQHHQFDSAERYKTTLDRCPNCNPSSELQHKVNYNESAASNVVNCVSFNNQKSIIRLVRVLNECPSNLLIQIIDVLKTLKSIILDKASNLNIV